jgi:hypothetical protein
VQPSALRFELEAGQLLEPLERDRTELAGVEQAIPAGQRVLRIAALQVVCGIEQVLAARLALATRERAQRVQATCDRGDKTALAAHIGGNRTEQRRRRLPGPVGAAEPLYRRVGAPAWLQEIVDAPRLVLRGKAGMIAAARPTRVREDEQAFVAAHESIGFGKVGPGGAVVQALPAVFGDEAPCPARYLRDGLGSESVDQRVERGSNRRQRAKLLDERVAGAQRRPAVDRPPASSDSGSDRELPSAS